MQIVALLPENPDEEHFRISQKAESRLAAQCDGNGLKAEQIKLQRHETLVHLLPAALDIALKPDVVHTEIAGAKPDGEVAGSKQEAIAKAESLGQGFLKSKNVTDELEKRLEKIEAGGWGIEPTQVPLKETTRKTYSVVDKCLKCMGAKHTPCALCHATGYIPCAPCVGLGQTPCTYCSGSGRVMVQGSLQPCNRCQAIGKTTCLTCQGQRRVICTTCRGATTIMCTECSGSGFWTHIFNVSYHADINFSIDRKLIPVDVMAVIDHLGVKSLETQGHAEIFRQPLCIEDGRAFYPMTAFLPIAKGEISIAGKHEELVVAGLNGEVVDIKPFLDPYLKSGISALLKLSKGPMAAQALIAQALKFKILRGTLSGLMHYSKKAVYQKLKKDYPLIVSDKYAKACITYAAQAMLAISDGPRSKGLLFGAGGSLALSALYFLAPVRSMLNAWLQASGLGKHILLADVAVWVFGYLLTVYTIKSMASKALHAILPDDDAGKRGLPPAGKQGGYALLATFVLWLITAFLAPAKPDWLLAILKAMGL